MNSLFILLPLFALASNLSFTNETHTQLVELIPQELDTFIQQQHSLSNYVEAYYSPLGRSPVVDAILGDPFYLPSYARIVGEKLKQSSQHNRLFEVFRTVLKAGVIPIENETLPAKPNGCPIPFLNVFGDANGIEIYSLWQAFIQIYREAESALGGLTPQEKQWIFDNREAFFFGKPGQAEYDFFTTTNEMPLKFFEFSTRVDLAKLTACAQRLCRIVDQVYQNRWQLETIDLEHNFIWEEQGLKLIVAGQFDKIQKESADFFLDPGGDHIYLNNAGGTEGKRAASLFIDLVGNHRFIGQNAVQGSGVLGIGVLANFGGSNIYQAKSYSQGAGFFGVGILMNAFGDNDYELGFFGQSCAVFGCSLLWDKKGDDHYFATEGMAQAASSTLGVAFLLNNEGDNFYMSGSSMSGLNRHSGMGQGSSIGIRNENWLGNPSFYGGLSFLYDIKGNHDSFWTPWMGQGSSYFLGVGILMVGDGNATFRSELMSQGQGIHFGAGLLLKEGGDDHYSGGWGSLGSATDHSVGMVIDTGGDDIVEGAGYSVGTARKPNALGVFIKTLGNAAYSFKNNSNANIQKPMTPEDWPFALFLDLNGINRYPEGVDHLIRCNNCRWNVETYGIGIDRNLDPEGLTETLFDQFPLTPRVNFHFDPLTNEINSLIFRPLQMPASEAGVQSLVQKIPRVDYNYRRQIYEILDLWRFIHKTKVNVSYLLKDPAHAAEDQLNYAFHWGLLDQNPSQLHTIIEALNRHKIPSAYSRKMAIRFVAYLGGDKVSHLLANMMATDPSEENRAYAALMLAKIPTQQALQLLKPALRRSSERLNYAAASGLKDSPVPGALSAVIPLLNSPSFYVRRAAALTAISLRYKPAIPVLLDTLHIDTLDTTDNYGDNLYAKFAPYVGVDFGVNREKWLKWWHQVKGSFEFPNKK